MTITLPDDARADLERRAAAANLRLEEYVLRAAYAVSPDAIKDLPIDETIRRWLAGAGGDPATIRGEAIEQRKKELEAALLAGVASGPGEPITAEFWDERQRELRDRQAARGDGRP
jgi:hypothetical protein